MTAKIALLSIFSLTLSASVLAVDPVTVTPSANAETYKLTYKGDETGKVTVSILDENNRIVFTEVLRDVTSFVRPYNFSELAEGQYSIKVVDKNGSHVEKISYMRSKTTIRVRELDNDSQKFVVTVINSKAERISVRIFENQKGLVYEGDIEVNGTQSILYNLSNLNINSSGIILFEVATSNGKVETAIF